MDSFAMPREAGISRESLRSSLFVALRSQPTGLLILDNCEHLASTDESLLNDLAAAAPHLRLVITSRVRPNNPAMRILELEPLDYEHRDETSGNLPPAVELFEKCAQDQDHRFRVTSEDYSYVQEICRQLDGIPLAVELAASRINLFAPSQILRRLADRKKFFAGMSSAGAFFPRSLSSAIRWSFDLLSTKARYVLTGLGRLPGGIFPEHAEQIISSTIDGVNALELIEELRRHSLIQTISTRFGKRLTIYRAIADELDELHQQFDSELLKAMWSNTGRVLCNATEPLLYELRTSRGPDAIDQILLERDNLLAVQRTAVNEGDMETASRAKLVLNEPLLLRGASVLLSQLWNTAPNDADGVRGIDLRIAHARWLRAINAWSEAQQEATCAFERARNVRDEVREHHACLELGLLANARGEFRVAQAYLQQIIQAKSSSVPHAVLVDALAGLGHAAERVETLGQARSRYDEALKLAQSCGDLAAQANLLRRKGNVATQLGSFDEALQFLNESIEIARVSEDLRNEHLALTSSGVVYSEMGQYEQAIDCYDRAQEIAVRIGAQRAVATNEGNRGVALAGLGDHVAAIHGYEIAEEINRKLGNYVAAATNLGNAAVSKAVLGDWQAATTTIQLAREQIQKCDDRIHLAIIEGDFGIMEYCCGRLEAAAELLKSAVNNLNAIGLGNSPLLIPYLECLVGCERERGNAQAAAELNADWQRLRALKSDAWIGRHPLMQTATQRGGAGAVEQSASGSWGKNVLSCRVLKVLR
jgi:tetratricopeptide (TPR) repeat protein